MFLYTAGIRDRVIPVPNQPFIVLTIKSSVGKIGIGGAQEKKRCEAFAAIESQFGANAGAKLQSLDWLYFRIYITHKIVGPAVIAQPRLQIRQRVGHFL